MHPSLDPLRQSPDNDGVSVTKRLKLSPEDRISSSPFAIHAEDIKIDALAEEVDLTADDDCSNPMVDVNYFEEYMSYQQQQQQQQHFGTNSIFHNSALSPHLTQKANSLAPVHHG